MEILQVFCTVNILTVEGCYDTALFKDLCKGAFHSGLLRK